MRRFALILTLTALCSTSWALGGDVVEPVTQSAVSPVSADKACEAAAKRLKKYVALNGWSITDKGNVPCDCKQDEGGWRCAITAQVHKPNEDDDVDNGN